MGSNTSKVNTENVNRSQRIDADNGPPSDPRSPTPEIARTPLNNKGGSKHNITKNVDLRKTFEGNRGDEKLIHNNPILSAVIKSHLQSYDPRSPTQEFDRTPIVLSSKVDELTDDGNLNLQCGSPSLRNDDDSLIVDDNKIPDGFTATKNLCNGFFDMTLDDTLKDSEAPLGSSTASNDSIENNIMDNEEKPKQLLETNFDYIDVNVLNDSEEKKHEEFKAPDTSEEPQKLAPIFKILDHDPRSPSIGIERTPIVVPKINEEESVEDMSDDTLIKVLQSTNAELKHSMNENSKNPEGLLIYEDEAADINITPKKSKSACTSGSRTPLSCMKNKGVGHIRSKSANTDSKDLKGNPKRVSHIPRLKSLSKQAHLISGSSVALKNKVAGITGDCENTPPNSHRDSWDHDNSIVL